MYMHIYIHYYCLFQMQYDEWKNKIIVANNQHDEENIKLRAQTFMSSNTDLHQDINGGIAFIHQMP